MITTALPQRYVALVIAIVAWHLVILGVGCTFEKFAVSVEHGALSPSSTNMVSTRVLP